MKSIRQRLVARNRTRAQRKLNLMFREYGHNDARMQNQVSDYLDVFCKDNSGEIKPDSYITILIYQMEEELRKEAE